MIEDYPEPDERVTFYDTAYTMIDDVLAENVTGMLVSETSPWQNLRLSYMAGRACAAVLATDRGAELLDQIYYVACDLWENERYQEKWFSRSRPESWQPLRGFVDDFFWDHERVIKNTEAFDELLEMVREELDGGEDE